MDAEAAAAIVRNKCASRLIPFLEKTDPTSYANWESSFLMNAARKNNFLVGANTIEYRMKILLLSIFVEQSDKIK